jgi:hypothetical protein
VQFCFQQKRKHMLHSISWQQYLTALTLVTACWYVYVALRYKLINFKTASPQNPLPLVAMAPVIGAVKPGEGEAVQPEELIFSISTPDDISDSTIPRGPADEFLDEAQTLADAAETKCEFLSLLEILVLKYEHDQLDFAALYNQLVLPYSINPDEWPLTQQLSA